METQESINAWQRKLLGPASPQASMGELQERLYALHDGTGSLAEVQIALFRLADAYEVELAQAVDVEMAKRRSAMQRTRKITEARIKDALQQKRTVQQLAGYLGSSKNTVSPWIKRLAASGKIAQAGQADDVRAGSGVCWVWVAEEEAA